LPPRLVDAADEVIRSVRWQRRDVEEFLGRHLSEPKPNVFFDPPARTPSLEALARALETRTLALHRKSQLLYANHAVFMNGEVYRFPRGVPDVLRRLADEGEIGQTTVPPAVAETLHEWFADGFLIWRRRSATRV
jgi:50S ribosomal protein L16 3-hydroxylase